MGGGAFSFFSEELRRELEHRKQLENDLRVAIADKSFQVYFQPQVSLSDGTIAGIEALVRWDHPTRGMVAPGEFIPVAEKSGLMAHIGRIVIAKAIAEAAEWHRSGIYFGRLAVNVSGTELREADFDKFLFDTLEKAGLPPQKLSLEIVESVILDDEKTGIAAKLRYIRSAGVHLELDDFGTGYASLSHVNPNEIDRLKIDRRFVQNINSNSDNTKIVRAITELARGLGISIIAEGAETEAELDFADVARLRPGAGLFDRIPDASRKGSGVARTAYAEEKASVEGSSRQSRLGFASIENLALCDTVAGQCCKPNRIIYFCDHHLPKKTIIAPITPDSEPAVLALNNEHAAELSWLEPEQLARLIGQAFYARRIGKIEAFLLAFDQSAAYDSPNFLWFRERFSRFVYVDRMAVSRSARGRGLARLLYQDLFSYAAAAGHTMVGCEVNWIRPTQLRMLSIRRSDFPRLATRQYTAARRPCATSDAIYSLPEARATGVPALPYRRFFSHPSYFD